VNNSQQYSGPTDRLLPEQVTSAGLVENGRAPGWVNSCV